MPPASTHRALPISTPTLGRRIGKYRVEDCLGEGAMGQVFRAMDTTLGRTVALKLVSSGGQEAMVRLLLEAQALARLEHPHICSIHEVGEWEGRPFLAMQFVEGETLQAAAPRLTLSEKVGVIRTVAEAMHAAHRLGLVHRDLKPANLMVTRGEGGVLHPVVLDFGLVRDMEGPGLTLTGMPMGTPAFMSPEQAEGESARVDRRSDIFSLGATLYASLLGRPPFEGAGPMDTLRRVLETEPAAPRSLDPHLPPDLETILLTCLQRDPARRYDTAWALAEDLRRFLEGEPIAAQRASLLSRWIRQIRRRPAVAASLASALVLLMVVLGLLVRQRVVLERTSRLASQVGAVARGVEDRMRMAFLLPHHPLAPDKTAVRARMAEVRHLMAGLPEAATGPAFHALGRGHMALGEWGQARMDLERAWSLQYRVPEAALSLGLVQAELYQRRLRAVSQLDPARKAPALEALHRELRDPAFRHLQMGKAASPSPATVEAQILALQGDIDGSLRQVAEAVRLTPAAYEAHLLAGALHQQRYLDALAVQDWAQVDAEEARTRQAYLAAAAIGRSDPRALEGLACLLIFTHNDRTLYRNEEVDHLLAETEAITEPLLRLDPESARGHVCRSYVLWRRARGTQDNARAVEEARLATRLDPDDDYGWVLLAATLSREVDHAWENGVDPEPAIQESRMAAEALLRLVPRGSHHGLIAQEKLGAALLRRFQYRVEQGRLQPGDGPEVRAALEAALEADPQYQFFEEMLAHFHLHEGWDAIRNGRDPRPAWEALLALSRRAHDRDTFAGPRLEIRLWAQLAQGDHAARSGGAIAFQDLERTLTEGQRLWSGEQTSFYRAKVALLRARVSGSSQGLDFVVEAARRLPTSQAAPLQAEVILLRGKASEAALEKALSALSTDSALAFERPGTPEALRLALLQMRHRWRPEPRLQQRIAEVRAALIRRNRMWEGLLGPG